MSEEYEEQEDMEELEEQEDSGDDNGAPMLGDYFPQVEVDTTHGPMSLPDDMAGKWFVLFSHPADFTPVCTTEFVAFAKRNDKFKALGAELIGLSIDQVFSHIKWVEWIKDNLDVDIPFPIIADDMGTLASALGMVSPSKGSNTSRAVWIVDDKGIVRLVMNYPQEIGRNMDEIVRALGALKTSDKNKVAMPAGWPNNELIGSKVIIPPAKDVKTAMERKANCDGYDWWFCYKDLESAKPAPSSSAPSSSPAQPSAGVSPQPSSSSSSEE